MAETALQSIGVLYTLENDIRDRALEADDKQAYRAGHSKPLVETFMDWCKDIAQRPDLIALDSQVAQGAKYVLNRRAALKVFLEDPDVPLDTNHDERT